MLLNSRFAHFRSCVMIFHSLFTYACKSVGGLLHVWKSFGAYYHWERVILKLVCLPNVYKSGLLAFYDIHSLYVFFFFFSFPNGINFIVLLPVSNQMDENLASNCGLGRFCPFGNTDSLYVRCLSLIVWFAKIAFRSIKDWIFLLICQCIILFQRLSGFQNSYGKNRPLIIVSWAFVATGTTRGGQEALPMDGICRISTTLSKFYTALFFCGGGGGVGFSAYWKIRRECACIGVGSWVSDDEFPQTLQPFNTLFRMASEVSDHLTVADQRW